MSDKPKSKKRATAIELFAGAGGLMLGLEMAGFNTLLVNEMHPDPCKTLRRNFPSTPIVNKNIRNLNGKKLLKLANIDLSPRCRVDLIAGGPPCQGFSNAGMKDPDDPRNTLIGDFIRIVKELKPRFFLMENVVGLSTLHKGKLFQNVLNQFADTKYNFDWKVFCVANYGVPQMRKRLIVFGSLNEELPPFPKATHAPNTTRNQKELFKKRLKEYIYCGEAIGDLPVIDQGEICTKYTKKPGTDFQKLARRGSKILYNHQASKHREVTMQYYGLVPPGGTWLDIPKHLRKKKQGMQRWPINGLSRTITTEPTDFIHPTLNRIPTIRELARIQTFPDKYEFLGQRTTGNKMRRLGYCAQSQQVGNAVPPLFAKALGKAIIKKAGS